MKKNRLKLFLIITICVGFSVTAISLVIIDRRQKKDRVAKVVDNMSKVYSGMMNYYYDYRAPLGFHEDQRTANQLLSILLYYGCEKSSFHVDNLKGFNAQQSKNEKLIKGDNIFAVNAGILMGIVGADAPLMIFPLIEENGKFIADKKPLGGKVAVLSCGGEIKLYKVGSNGEIITEDGTNLLDESHPHWKGAKNDFRLPERVDK